MRSKDIKGQVGFAIGTGRCGTKFLADVMALETHVRSVHERNVINETFHRYCKWYGLPVDHEGFLHIKNQEIEDNLKDYNFSFEASAHLSLSIEELYERFEAKFVLLVRSPERVVNSHLTKTWYNNKFVQKDPHLALGYQEQSSLHYFFGRIAPTGDKFRQWNSMTRIGKLAWFWSALNNRTLNQLEKIPKTHWRVEKLEDLSYEHYLEIVQFFGFESTITKETFNNLAQRRPNAASNVPCITDWSPRHIAEFEMEVANMAKKLGCEYRVNRIPAPQLVEPSVVNASKAQRIKQKRGLQLQFINKLFADFIRRISGFRR